jgi:hypothetical protein
MFLPVHFRYSNVVPATFTFCHISLQSFISVLVSKLSVSVLTYLVCGGAKYCSSALSVTERYGSITTFQIPIPKSYNFTYHGPTSFHLFQFLFENYFWSSYWRICSVSINLVCGGVRYCSTALSAIERDIAMACRAMLLKWPTIDCV